MTYDPDGGASFPTYAQRVVENGLRTYCRLQHSKERRSFPVSEIFDTEADGHRAMASGIRSLQEQLAEVDALSLLESAKQQYNGVVRLGIAIGKQRVILRRATSKVTAKNAAVLSFLELMNEMPAPYFSEGRKKLTIEFITKNGITRRDITEYAPAFPDKAMRTLVESEIIYHVTQ